MTKDKKIELQAKIIHELQEENMSLIERIKELEKIVDDNKVNADAVNTYHEEQEKCIASLKEAKDGYLQATKNLIEQKKKYKKDMEHLLKTIRKNT